MVSPTRSSKLRRRKFKGRAAIVAGNGKGHVRLQLKSGHAQSRPQYLLSAISGHAVKWIKLTDNAGPAV